MSNVSVSPSIPSRGHRVREFVCTYRPLRDSDGRIVDVPTVMLNDPRTAAAVLSPLLADQSVEVCAVACLSTKRRLLAWHVLSRGSRACTSVSIPDVFVPACLTPGCQTVVVVTRPKRGTSGSPVPGAQRLQHGYSGAGLCPAALCYGCKLLGYFGGAARI